MMIADVVLIKDEAMVPKGLIFWQPEIVDLPPPLPMNVQATEGNTQHDGE